MVQVAVVDVEASIVSSLYVCQGSTATSGRRGIMKQRADPRDNAYAVNGVDAADSSC